MVVLRNVILRPNFGRHRIDGTGELGKPDDTTTAYLLQLMITIMQQFSPQDSH
jgi:hypothetical protein